MSRRIITALFTLHFTVALMQAMEESCAKGRPVKIKDVLARHGLRSLLQK